MRFEEMAVQKKKKKRRRKKEEEVSSEEDLIKIVITISLDGAIAIIKCLGILGAEHAPPLQGGP